MRKLSWTVEPGTMIIKIMDDSDVVMRIFIGEAMELAGRHQVMTHVSECDRSLWLADWQQEKQEAETDKIVDRLQGKL
jgi:hypothetical protein